MMKLFRRLFHPMITFIAIQIIWILILVSWIYWFLGRHRQFKELAIQYQADWLPQKTDWLILAEGIVLLVAILVGVYVIFIYWRRQSSLYKAQQRFISQVTHELKSPLASLRLHLDTIQMRPPTNEQLNYFVNLMQKDCSRLDSMISNLLHAGHIQHNDSFLNLQRGNLSELMESYLRTRHSSLPAGTDLDWTIEPGLVASFDADGIETVLRNLFENAVLYTDGPPRIRVEMRRNASMAHIVFSDFGREIPYKLRKKIFNMFYRVRHHGQSVRGSGLGLFIVKNIIKMHNGRIWLDTPKGMKGNSFHLLLPLINTRPSP